MKAESTKPSPEGLIRGIRKWDLIAVTINGIIGAGIFGLPAKVYALIGSYNLIVFLGFALVVTLIFFFFAPEGSPFDAPRGPFFFFPPKVGPPRAVAER